MKHNFQGRKQTVRTQTKVEATGETTETNNSNKKPISTQQSSSSATQITQKPTSNKTTHCPVLVFYYQLKNHSLKATAQWDQSLRETPNRLQAGSGFEWLCWQVVRSLKNHEGGQTKSTQLIVERWFVKSEHICVYMLDLVYRGIPPSFLK